MRRRRAILAFLFAAIATAAVPYWNLSTDAAEAAGILTGTIKTAAAAKLEGVTVSAKIDGHTITTSVYTDAQGEYFLPSDGSGCVYGLGAGRRLRKSAWEGDARKQALRSVIAST